MALLQEMTREQIRRIAPQATVVLPVASIEQHGPHLPVWTDSLICDTIARQAAEETNLGVQVVVAPILCYGISHHHFPFPGVLSLTSQSFLKAVTDILESLIRGGFRKLIVLNGHGGNSEAIGLVASDVINRLGHPVSIATAAYWDVARAALVAKNLLPNELIPGHAGRFETALVLAIRPDLVDRAAMAQMADISDGAGPSGELNGAVVHVHGAWAASPGYSDNASGATVEVGQVCLEVIVQTIADFFAAFHNLQGGSS